MGEGKNFGNFRSKYDCFFIVSRIYSRIYRFNCWRRRFNFYAGITGPRVACNFALGTNKLAASMGGLMSVFSFWRAGKINQKVAISLMPLSFLGSALGAYVVYLLPEQLMKNVIVVLLVAVAVYTYRRKDWGDVSAVKQLGLAALLGSVVMAFGIGFYDGFFGPGTGSFLIFGFLFLGYDFVTAAGNAKALNFASWYRSAVVFYFKWFSL